MIVTFTRKLCNFIIEFIFQMTNKSQVRQLKWLQMFHKQLTQMFSKEQPQIVNLHQHKQQRYFILFDL